jgi:acyl carrier protein
VNMTREQIRSALTQLLEEDTGNNYAGLDDGKKLREELGLDSVDLVSVIMQIERRFHIRLAPEELQSVVTVGNMLDLLAGKISPDAAAA